MWPPFGSATTYELVPFSNVTNLFGTFFEFLIAYALRSAEIPMRLAFGRQHLTIRSDKPPRKSAIDAGSGVAEALTVPVPETVKSVVPRNPSPETDPVAPANSPVPPVKVNV
jgi:hypothetical protein